MTDFQALYSQLASQPRPTMGQDSIVDKTIVTSNPSPHPNLVQAEMVLLETGPITDPYVREHTFLIKENLDPASWGALSHEIHYKGSYSIAIHGDQSGYCFTNGEDAGSYNYWGDKGIYLGPWRSNNDLIVSGAGNDILYGHSGNDSLYGNSGNDMLYGGYGNDSLEGGNGKDFLFGELGDDKMHGGDDDDYMEGGSGTDEMYGDAGDDEMYGQSDNDAMDGGSGHDYMDGGAGDDILLGGTGNDTLYGGAGLDYLLGGAGNDVYIFGQGAGVNAVVEDIGAGSDKVYIKDYTLNTVWFDKIDDNLVIYNADASDMMQFTDWFLNFEVEGFYFEQHQKEFSSTEIAGMFGYTIPQTEAA